MAILRVTFTEDMLKLIPCINFKEIPATDTEIKNKTNICIDFDSLYGGSFVFEDMSFILGIYDKHIPGTENNPLGPRFPEELEDYMWETHRYIVENIVNIEEILHQFSVKGGIKAATYKCKSNEHFWEIEK